MAWTYDASDLDTTTASGRLNTVRLLVGDTDTLDQQKQDEEVVFALSESSDNVYTAAGWICRAIAAKYSRLVNSEMDGSLRAEYSSLSKQYVTLSQGLEYQGKVTSGSSLGLAAGGLTKSDVTSVRSNTDRVEGAFRRDRFRNPPSYTTPEYK